MQASETASEAQTAVSRARVEGRAKHRYRFSSVKDSRKRKVRGLWRRGDTLYMQTRVAGERSARKIRLKSTGLEAAKAEMADITKKKRGEGLPGTGLRPFFADYARDYLKFQRTARDSGPVHDMNDKLPTFKFNKRAELLVRAHNETLSVAAMRVNNEDCPGLYPVIRNSLVGLAPYLGKFRALNQIGEFHCHSFFSELRPLPVVVQ